MHGTHTSPLYVYRLSPIDFWTGWSKAQDAVRAVHFDELIYPEVDSEKIDPETWESRWRRAKQAAAKLGWAGDIRNGAGGGNGPFVAGLPDGNCNPSSEFMIGWKEDNNGTSYIASPIRLPWLEEADNHVAYVDELTG